MRNQLYIVICAGHIMRWVSLKKGLEYIEKAYQLKSIDAGQSINYGNSYYGLARYEEAIEKI